MIFKYNFVVKLYLASLKSSSGLKYGAIGYSVVDQAGAAIVPLLFEVYTIRLSDQEVGLLPRTLDMIGVLINDLFMSSLYYTSTNKF